MKKILLLWIMWIMSLLGLYVSNAEAAVHSSWNLLTGLVISGWNATSYTAYYIISGTLNTGDVVHFELSGSWWMVSSMYTWAGWETQVMFSVNTSGISDWSVLLSGMIADNSGNLISWSNINTTILKDTMPPGSTASYSTTWNTSSPVIATLILNEIGIVTNNAWSRTRTFNTNGSFVFTYTDTAGNTWSQLAVVSNIIQTLPGWSTYIFFPVWWGARKDYCPYWDNSTSQYDWDCNIQNNSPSNSWMAVEVTWRIIEVPEDAPMQGSITNSPYSNEVNLAYLYAYEIGATTIPTIQQANIKWQMTRWQMAKILSRYTVSILGQKADSSKECNYSDIFDQSYDLQNYIRLACQLGIIASDVTIYNPNGIVTRAEFGTVLSRALYGSTYEYGYPYYMNHLQALKDNGIITNIDANIIESRWNIMLMLMRAPHHN